MPFTVRGGFGGGTYAAKASASMLANPTPVGFVFDHWQTTVALRATFAVPTRLDMPARAMLSPVYRAASAWTSVVKVRPNGSNVYHYYPAPAAHFKGIMSFHHGATGTMRLVRE
ncbi:hypothetical protein CDA63_18300 [Hymenobacter amundsenii]|uniref:Uncharacterized protein n=1 Tax=Hymenobacter amundsenii TaxID=2006685 RepID=A0A246FJ47_9BACT|nr:hypothetical protein CDA63_18300 [Hymenobacter amundsenii]